MAIPETQLDTWSHQGSVTQSKDTYAAIRKALEVDDAGYSDKKVNIFLQGSYGNDTNIYSESDVDVVIQLVGTTFVQDITRLNEAQKSAFNKAYSDATYTYWNFKSDVEAVLRKKFGDKVEPGKKAIKIKGEGNRRNADVIVAIEYRRYLKFNGIFDESYIEGICFYTSDGTRIANYPKQHSVNCTAKHQATNSWFKPMVRIFKNMRRRLVANGELAAGVAPSYYIEGLVYNAPNDCFGSSYVDSFVKCFNWISEADKSQFVCANEQYYLLRNDPNVTWSESNFNTYMDALKKQWDNWGS